MIRKQCVICNGSFFVNQYRIDTAKCCGKNCAYKLKKGKPSPRDRRLEKVCKSCGVIFKTKQSEDANYCSNKCVGTAKRTNLDPDFRKCAMCHEVKSINEFRCSDKRTSRKRYECRLCVNALTRERARTTRGRWNNARSMAKRRGLVWDIPLNDFEQLVGSPCSYCGEPLSPCGHGLDRIDNGKAYTADNVVVACGECNVMRGDTLSYEEMLMLSPCLRAIKAARKLKATNQQ